ncbi:MAG: tRNA 2-thiouridine(34) synthase MnmA [Pseudomonadales bacterium]|nr:tRNA 2-thiouridine(34) synthase MnmA [Pseudomonadales bacterium]
MGAPPSVVVGLSGGVDSAVAALLLKRAGYRVSALFMKNWDDDDGTEYCTARDDLMDAERVCHHLDIDLCTANFAAEYRDNVFAHFLAEYSAGRTPNPDILCNREIKFRQFADHAVQLGADLIATGHYARGVWQNGLAPAQALAADPQAADFRLLKGVDPAKDQTYFLQAVPRAQLARCLFPLGGLEKRAVREIARREGLHNHRRKDSTGICFIGERRFREFLQRYLPVKPGPIVDMQGRVLGEHQGLAYYTLGQRQGLGIGGVRGQAEAPWYVQRKVIETNTLVVTQCTSDLDSTWLVASDPNWLFPPPAMPFACEARVRYRQADQPATVAAAPDGRIEVRFHTPQRAVTPGQYVALYRGDVCLGGALIETNR